MWNRLHAESYPASDRTNLPMMQTMALFSQIRSVLSFCPSCLILPTLFAHQATILTRNIRNNLRRVSMMRPSRFKSQVYFRGPYCSTNRCLNITFVGLTFNFIPRSPDLTASETEAVAVTVLCSTASAYAIEQIFGLLISCL